MVTICHEALAFGVTNGDIFRICVPAGDLHPLGDQEGLTSIGVCDAGLGQRERGRKEERGDGKETEGEGGKGGGEGGGREERGKGRGA